ncbi:KilA-N domain-containing protein [Candidatus Saccharibacteria bacterium]|nr:KilA-N domain-containing protein [Candidatus Saccharibacteria bacterium]
MVISLTDLARYSNPEKPSDVIVHWLSNKSTFNYIGLWEKINNPNFNFAEFREIKTEEVGTYSFTMSPKRWIKSTDAIGIISKGGRYSIGTFAHPDIAFEFASWLNPEFKLYLIREFERLKKNEAYHEKLEWRANRLLAKANYLIQTDAIKQTIIPTITESQKRFIYAEEADVLNVALFGMTAKEWREENPELAKTGNIRDYTDLLHLIILNNLENVNALLIKDNLSQSERLAKLNEIAKSQMQLLLNSKSMGEVLGLGEGE